LLQRLCQPNGFGNRRSVTLTSVGASAFLTRDVGFPDTPSRLIKLAASRIWLRAYESTPQRDRTDVRLEHVPLIPAQAAVNFSVFATECPPSSFEARRRAARTSG
jgi:hypothetical protein